MLPNDLDFSREPYSKGSCQPKRTVHQDENPDMSHVFLVETLGPSDERDCSRAEPKCCPIVPYTDWSTTICSSPSLRDRRCEIDTRWYQTLTPEDTRSRCAIRFATICRFGISILHSFAISRDPRMHTVRILLGRNTNYVLCKQRKQGSPFPSTTHQVRWHCILLLSCVHNRCPPLTPSVCSSCFRSDSWLTDIIPKVIELALTAAAKEDRERFSLVWLRQQSEECLSRMFDWILSMHGSLCSRQKIKKANWPPSNQGYFVHVGKWGSSLRYLPILPLNCDVQERLGYFRLQRGTRDNDISVYMSAGGRHECAHLMMLFVQRPQPLCVTDTHTALHPSP